MIAVLNIHPSLILILGKLDSEDVLTFALVAGIEAGAVLCLTLPVSYAMSSVGSRLFISISLSIS